MLKVMYAYLPEDGEIACLEMNGQMIPLIFPSLKLINAFKEQVKLLANSTNTKFRLVKFLYSETLEEFEPKPITD